MTYQIREYIAFDGELFNIQSTMDFIRSLLANDAIEYDVYSTIMSVLVELRSGYPYEDDELINALSGGYVTYKEFFMTWGTGTIGRNGNPIDLTTEDEIEEVIEIDHYIGGDLMSALEFFDEMDALDIMNDEIGEFDGSLYFDDNGSLTVSMTDTDDGSYTLGSTDSYSI